MSISLIMVDFCDSKDYGTNGGPSSTGRRKMRSGNNSSSRTSDHKDKPNVTDGCRLLSSSHQDIFMLILLRELNTSEMISDKMLKWSRMLNGKDK